MSYGGSTFILRRNSSKRAELPARIQVLSANGAINIADHNIPDVVLITKATAAAVTLAAPTSGAPDTGGHDGKIIRVVDAYGAAHTLTITAGFGGAGTAGDVGTFSGTIGAHVDLIAYQGTWYVIDNVGVTIA